MADVITIGVRFRSLIRCVELLDYLITCKIGGQFRTFASIVFVQGLNYVFSFVQYDWLMLSCNPMFSGLLMQNAGGTLLLTVKQIYRVIFLTVPLFSTEMKKCQGANRSCSSIKSLLWYWTRDGSVAFFLILVLNKGGTGKKSPSISPISHWFLFRANASETDLFYLSSVTLVSPHCCWKWSRDRFVFLSSVTPGRSNKPRMQPHNWHEMIVRML